MKKIRFIQLGGNVSTLLSNLVIKLNEIQSEYQFEVAYKTISLVKIPKGKGYHDKYLFKVIKKYMIDNDFLEYPIAFTNKMLVDELISISDKTGAIISTYPFKKYSKYDDEICSLYTIASILPDIEHQITAVHRITETRGCPNDYCDNLADIDVGIAKGEYCPDCYNKLLEAMENKLISYQEMSALSRILDYVAGRNVCFVIMPFDRKFNSIYKVIKKCLLEYNYECYRGDEIFETRNIIDIVNERIMRANLIIADLTGRNSNVFYELGFAHAKGKQTILIAQKASDVPFDLRHRQRFIYHTGSKLEQNIKSKLIKYIHMNK